MWVIKYGGNAMTDASERAQFLSDVRALRAAGGAPVLVHGGGPFIAEALAQAGIESRFENGLRVTSKDAVAVVERVLTLLGKSLAGELGDAVGLTGRDARLLHAERFNPVLGEVGRMQSVRADLLRKLLEAGVTPVVGCLALDAAGEPLNVNADEVAGAVAAALAAPCVFLTNVPGVLDNPGDPATILRSLSRADVNARMADGRISGGMIPKVQGALEALAQGAPAAVIADGRVPGVLAGVMAGTLGTQVLP
jgi:acetylglutamate kinase